MLPLLGMTGLILIIAIAILLEEGRTHSRAIRLPEDEDRLCYDMSARGYTLTSRYIYWNFVNEQYDLVQWATQPDSLWCYHNEIWTKVTTREDYDLVMAHL